MVFDVWLLESAVFCSFPGPRLSTKNPEMGRSFSLSKTLKSSFIKLPTMRPSLFRTTTGTKSRLTFTSSEGALYCVSTFERGVTDVDEDGRGWLAMLDGAVVAAESGTAAGRCSGSQSVALLAAFCSG